MTAVDYPHQRIAEIGRGIEQLQERVAQLEAALNGMIGLIQLLSHNRDIPPDIRADMTESHRFIDAQACFPDTDWSEYKGGEAWVSGCQK